MSRNPVRSRQSWWSWLGRDARRRRIFPFRLEQQSCHLVPWFTMSSMSFISFISFMKWAAENWGGQWWSQCFNLLQQRDRHLPPGTWQKCHLWTALILWELKKQSSTSRKNPLPTIAVSGSSKGLFQDVGVEVWCVDFYNLTSDFRYVVAAGAGHFIEYFEGAAQALRSHNNDIL